MIMAWRDRERILNMVIFCNAGVEDGKERDGKRCGKSS
jgi:hypothetical protein